MYENLLEDIDKKPVKGKYVYPTTVSGAYSLIYNYCHFKSYTRTLSVNGVDFAIVGEG